VNEPVLIRESAEHVLWEQLRWFEEYVKGAEVE